MMAGCKAFIENSLWGGDTLAGRPGGRESGGSFVNFCFFRWAGMEFAERPLSFQQVIHNTQWARGIVLSEQCWHELCE